MALSGKRFGLKREGLVNIPTNKALSSTFKSRGSLLKYTLDADLIPTAPFTKSTWFKYKAMISCLVYCLSNRIAIIHSLAFCTILKGRNLEPSP